MCRVYVASQIPHPPYGSNWGHKIADFVFLLYIHLFLPLELKNVLRGVGKPM